MHENLQLSPLHLAISQNLVFAFFLHALKACSRHTKLLIVAGRTKWAKILKEKGGYLGSIEIVASHIEIVSSLGGVNSCVGKFT
jgi:hypothetical protein